MKPGELDLPGPGATGLPGSPARLGSAHIDQSPQSDTWVCVGRKSQPAWSLGAHRRDSRPTSPHRFARGNMTNGT